MFGGWTPLYPETSQQEERCWDYNHIEQNTALPKLRVGGARRVGGVNKVCGWMFLDHERLSWGLLPCPSMFPVPMRMRNS